MISASLSRPGQDVRPLVPRPLVRGYPGKGGDDDITEERAQAMSDKDNNKNSPAASKGPRTSRRRLLKAGAAVPVVYTLSSGSALAAMSQACDLKDGNVRRISEQLGDNIVVDGVNYTVVDGSVTINGQTFVVDGNELITQSCWSSLVPGGTSGGFI
jgi:hypothetical protein